MSFASFSHLGGEDELKSRSGNDRTGAGLRQLDNNTYCSVYVERPEVSDADDEQPAGDVRSRRRDPAAYMRAARGQRAAQARASFGRGCRGGLAAAKIREMGQRGALGYGEGDKAKEERCEPFLLSKLKDFGGDRVEFRRAKLPAWLRDSEKLERGNREDDMGI